ncbi:carbamoyltransferase N-terminal domain-containing protein [Mycolicibacterium vanbaalenii]|uniref:carbamoyltransferase N-terminal domain-containing protein n=1 Tax=Mycolicibacterium vanbaalenii TaxID=110539 RepID=UPI0023BAAD01|nr:carbamoyltransferase N-terminal domain-containing protein [Mycolicibacterium vanbaalenii]
MSSWILGVGLSHDASACLLRDGSPMVGVQLERLTGRKRDGRKELAHLMIDYCLTAAAISFRDLDAVGVSFPDVYVPDDMFLPHFDSSAKNVLHVGHHLAHAYSAFAPSEFDEAAVLVIDGHGDSYYESDEDRLVWGNDLWAGLKVEESSRRDLGIAPRSEVESIYTFDRQRPPSLAKRNFMGWGRRANRHRGPTVNVGIGANYKFASSVLFGPGEHSGKVMGLAPYGTARQDLVKSYWLTDSGDLVLDDLWRHQVRKEVHDQPDLPANREWAAGLAAYVQRETAELGP